MPYFFYSPGEICKGSLPYLIPFNVHEFLRHVSIGITDHFKPLVSVEQAGLSPECPVFQDCQLEQLLKQLLLLPSLNCTDQPLGTTEQSILVCHRQRIFSLDVFFSTQARIFPHNHNPQLNQVVLYFSFSKLPLQTPECTVLPIQEALILPILNLESN